MPRLLNRLYYSLKPALPWSACIAARRWVAARKRVTCADVWPIDEKAGASPPNWPGWPDGKRFALVLTHDVEGPKGFNRVDRLMQLEARYGFKSSFNFVPEDSYHVSDDLRNRLDHAGFEVGVHGLSHDGKLYFSKARFAAAAGRIRRYIREWKSAGFRSPHMHHRLAWQHLLGAEYDSSTFDTDPFEPESDGVGTIFPFWAPGPDGAGYVELPGTLVQDFSLFVVLREKSIDVWKRKLDWIAERGGMALLITHPDYMCFEGAPQRDEFPVSFYEEFLQYAREKYADEFWPALPREVSRFYTASLPVESRNSRKKICFLTYSDYESNHRVRRYAEELARRGDHVDVIALATENAPLGQTEIEGVGLFRIQTRKHDERSKWTYAARLLRFFCASSLLLTRRHHAIRYDLIHVHNIPDFMVFTAWYPKWTGARVILDIHDIVPELFVNKFETHLQNFYFTFLKWVEKASAAFADHVIIANHLWYKKLISRSAPEAKCSVYLNHVDQAVFYPRARTRRDGPFVILFHGSFQWHQGLDIAVAALAHVRTRIPNAELHLYGSGGGAGTQTRLAEQANRLGLNGSVKFCGVVPLHRVPEVVANADLGIVPKRADSFGNEAYSTKIMEFMSQGVPVVVSRTKIDTFYFNDQVVRFFPSGDSRAMADAIIEVAENPSLRESLIRAGLDYVAHNSWDVKKNDYLALVDSLSTEAF